MTVVATYSGSGSSYIGYTNLVKTGTVTVTSEAVGFEKANAQTYTTYSWWKAVAAGKVYYTIDMGSPVAIDSWGLTGHNLGDNSGTVKVQSSSDNATWSDFDSLVSAVDHNTIFRKTTSIIRRHWRFEVDSIGSASFIGNFFLGVALKLQKGMRSGFAPASLMRDREIYNNMTEAGNYTGRILLNKGSKVSIQQTNITRAWIDSYWKALADHIELYPFYFAYDTSNYPNDVAYCMANKITFPSYQTPLYMKFGIDCVALYDV